MKSHANGPLAGMVEWILRDSATRCAVDEASMIRDLMKIRERMKCEGDAFLTITLPNFGGDFERSLAKGMVTSEAFSRLREGSRAPGISVGFPQARLRCWYRRHLG